MKTVYAVDRVQMTAQLSDAIADRAAEGWDLVSHSLEKSLHRPQAYICIFRKMEQEPAAPGMKMKG